MRKIRLAAPLAISLYFGPACSGVPSPPTTSTRTLQSLQPLLTRQLTPAEARARIGVPDEETGSGLRIYIYNLEDGKRLWLGFPGDAPIVYARLQGPGGMMSDLELR